MRPRRKKLPFFLGIAIILTTLSWLGYSGIQESKTYYVTVNELFSSQDVHDRRYRVAGDVTVGSTQRTDGRVRFQIESEGASLNVVYTGTEPLPDTLMDRAQAIVDGRYREDGTFYAEVVQAKCASKYEPAVIQDAGPVGEPAS
jgi:cytochrome c-type biogenesis protein CcmE